MSAAIIATDQVVHMLADRLIRLGFVLAHKSKTGSHYLRWPGSPFQLRLSDHMYSRFSKEQQAQVVKIFIPPPCPEERVDGMALDVAIGFVIRSRLRRGIIGKEAAA